MSTISPPIPAAPAMPVPTEAELAQAIRTLQFVAVQAITRLIGTEADPRELRRLLTIAPRYRIPTPSPKSPPRPPTEPRTRTDKHPASTTHPRNQAEDQSPDDDDLPNNALESDLPDDDLPDDDLPEDDLPDHHLPPLLPMTDEQYFALVKEIGITEATRRRAINAAAIAADRKRARGSS